MTTSDGWPPREEVERRWVAILDGALTREQAHEWTVPWVEGRRGDGPPTDTLVGTGLQYLHGFTMASFPDQPNLIHHGPPGEYVKSLEQIRADLDWWRSECTAYDADPEAWRLRKRREAARMRR